MRILFACEFYFPSVGGVQEVMRQLAERLVERGHQVTVATSCLPERTSREINGVQIREFDVSGNMARGMYGDVEGYRRYVTACDFDVLMVKAAQQWTMDALVPVLERIVKPKVFIPCGFSGFYEPAFAEYFRAMPGWLGKFDHLIFYASDYRDINFARQHGIANLTVIQNGASEREFAVERDPGFRARHGIAEDAFVLLTVGTLTRLKGHLEIAKAFEQCDLGDRRAVLLLNGNVPLPVKPTGFTGWARLIRQRWAIGVERYRNDGALEVMKWIAQYVLRAMGSGRDAGHEGVRQVVARINAGESGRRAMLVDLPRCELVQAYLNSDLFVFASKVEYSPLVLYEAAAAGLPFLSARVGNADEIARWTGGGVVVPAPTDSRGYTQVDPSAFAREIARLVAQPDLLERLGAEGRRNWEERFTWDKITTRYERVFQECIADARK